MTSLRSISVLMALGLVLVLSGCGAERPFRRGETSKNEGGQSEKPVVVPTPTTSATPSPTPGPTDAPWPTNTPVPTEEPIPTETPSPSLEPSPTPAATLNRSYFSNEILPLLEAKKINGTTRGCSGCHENKVKTFEKAESMVVVGNPEQSQLYQIATGAPGSGHPRVWKSDSPEALKLMLWISGKAL